MKREAAFRPATQDDVKWLYAAYRKSNDAQRIGLREGMTPVEFDAEIPRIAPPHWAHWMLLGPVVGKEGLTPIGLMTGEPWGGRRIRVGIWLFPWASPRNRLVSLVNVANRMRGMSLVIAAVRRKDLRLADHICRYGIAKRAGTIHGWFDDGDDKDAALFQTKDLI